MKQRKSILLLNSYLMKLYAYPVLQASCSHSRILRKWHLHGQTSSGEGRFLRTVSFKIFSVFLVIFEIFLRGGGADIQFISFTWAYLI